MSPPKRFMISVSDEMIYFGLARELSHKHHLNVKQALQILVDEYCLNPRARVLIDSILEGHLNIKDASKEQQGGVSTPQIVAGDVCQDTNLSDKEREQVATLSNEFNKTRAKLKAMNGSEDDYLETRDHLYQVFDERLCVFLGV